MGRLTLITGGAASGKSTHALRLASTWGPRVLFIATCVPRDDEMHAKVARHKAQRPTGWTTLETADNLAAALAPGFDGAIVDCLTLLISQWLVADIPESDILSRIDVLTAAAKRTAYPVALVSNEVGLGLVPDNPLGRRFREIAGRANQLVAARADDVELLVSGISVRIKHAD